jgi:GH24 family phage-related lysozyme (muramidase)
MKNAQEAIRRLRFDEGNYLFTYDDGDGNWPHPHVYPNYPWRAGHNPTIANGLLLDSSGLAVLKSIGVPDPKAVFDGIADITQEQCDAIITAILPKYVSYARAALATGVFDSMTEARQYAMVSMAYNLGDAGLCAWAQSLNMIDAAQKAKVVGAANARELFNEAADHMLTNSLWLSQVGDRGRRIIAMIRQGVYCDPQGSGSDIL